MTSQAPNYHGYRFPPQDVDHIAILVDRPPEIVLPALHRDEQFIEIPRVNPSARADAGAAGRRRRQRSDTSVGWSRT